MASSFFGLEIAKTGLFISQKQLNTTGHNIANADTAGYTRQRVVATSIDPTGLFTRFAPMEKGRVGGGVKVQILDQIRCSFTDRELRRRYSDAEKDATKADKLMYLETLFNEKGDASISAVLAKFFGSINTLSTDAASGPYRANVQGTAKTLASTINYYYDKLVEQQRAEDDLLKSAADRASTILEQIAKYNEEIFGFEITGEMANDLRDKRNLLLDELSQLMDIEYEEVPGSATNNMLTKLIVRTSDGSQELVNHKDYVTLAAVKNVPNPIAGEDMIYSIQISTTYAGGPATNVPLYFTTGEMQAHKDMRDGDTTANYGIPYIVHQLDELARKIAEQFNDIHSAAWTLPKDGNPSVTGINFFYDGDTGAGADYSVVTAKTFRLSDDIDGSGEYWNIACSLEPVTTAPDGQHHGDNLKMLELVELISSKNVPGIGNFEDYLKEIVVELAVESARVQTIASSEIAVVGNLEEKRQSISGVNIDEEVTNMLKFQHAYAANSRMITAIDECLDVLINRTGVVGL